MKWALILFAAVSLVELLLWTDIGWKYRKQVAGGILVVQSVLVGTILGFSPGMWTGLVLIASGYRAVNLLRLIEGRMEADYLFVVSRRTSVRLMAGQLLIILLWLLTKHLQIRPNVYLGVLGVVELLAVFILAFSTRRSIKKAQPYVLNNNYASRDLPSISVLIPARNETVDLEQCLTSIVASNYPKLEILVLDDCSQNKHTPEIIKSFAQAGVRFIAGDMPPDSWLAKNFAYSQLAAAASGEILVFAGVDTRFSPDTLTFLVETLLEKKKIMASVMPINKLTKRIDLASCLVQPIRYAWELSLPRRLVNRPPVLSTCWVIYSNKLTAYGGFKAVSRSNSPESYFAGKAIRENDGYSFIRSTKAFGLFSEKTFYEQRQTAVRTRYPQAHRRLELVGLFSVAEIVAFLMPIFNVVWGLANLSWLIFSLGVVCLVWLSLTYGIICQVTYSKFMIRALIVWPIVAIYDICLIHYSMWRYEFKEVLWKGRNVCLPVMRASVSDQAQSK